MFHPVITNRAPYGVRDQRLPTGERAAQMFCESRLTQDDHGGNVSSVRVWVSAKEAKQIRTWAVEEGWRELADRF